MRQKNAAWHGALLLTAVSLFSQILAFFYRVWLARLISAEAIGLYQLVIPAYAIIMSLCVSGFTVAVSRLTASYAALGRTRAIRQAVNTARAGYLVMVLAVSLVIIPLSDTISVTLLGDARCRLGLILLLPCIVLTGWENVHKNYFYGRKNVIPPSISEVLEQTVRVASILGLLLFFSPAYEETQVGLIVLGMVISEVVSAALLTVLYRRDKRRWPVPAPEDTHEPDMLGTVRKIAVPVAAANLLTNLIGSANSIIIPGRLIISGVDSSEALSAFGIAFGMTMPLLLLPLVFSGSIGTVMLPRLAENAAVRDFAAIRRQIKTALLAAAAAVSLCTAILIPFGADIARTLFQNPDAGRYMVPLAVATVFICFETLLGTFLNALGKQKDTAANFIFAGIVQLVLTWWGVGLSELRLGGFVLAYIAGGVMGSALCAWDLWQAVREESGES
ncbi:MAG: oligosaccharide flippase family protein [Oscillospiraceae bacterium]|nr:oligosaccharide flippase family protein [Oscillospiraceae bacterium]